MTEDAPSKCIFEYQDILDTLFQCLPNPDLKNLRLTHKYLAEIAKTALFSRCYVMVADLDEFSESSVARYVRKLEIRQFGDFLFVLIDNDFWHNMPKLSEVKFTSIEDTGDKMGEAIVSSAVLAKLKRFSARVRVVQLPKSLPSTLEHLELIDCDYVENREALSTCRYSLRLYDVRLHSPLALHSSLTHLNIYMSEIELSNLSPSLISLKYIAVREYPLPEALPAGLQYLDCSSNDWSSLPHLPGGLKYLDCSYNRIESIENLPPSLEALICNFNRLASLPIFPKSLKMLSCSDNPLEGYFSSTNSQLLPPSLKALIVIKSCRKGFTLPLPSGLLYLICTHNNLTSLPLLPPSLEVLNCSKNKLQSLPPLPTSLKILRCSENELTFLPTLPKSIRLISLDTRVSVPPIPVSRPSYLHQLEWALSYNWEYVYTKIL